METTVETCVRALCAIVCAGPEEGEAFEEFRNQCRAVLDAAWPGAEALPSIVEYMSVPSHVLACTDLDFQGFGRTSPLMIGSHPIPLHRLLEGFSHTNPERYGAVWVPVLDLSELTAQTGPNHREGLRRARAHIEYRLRPGKHTIQMDPADEGDPTVPGALPGWGGPRRPAVRQSV